MGLSFRPLHPLFVAQVEGCELCRVADPAILAELRSALDRYAVLVFRDQPIDDDEQCAFAERLGGPLQQSPGKAALVPGTMNRLGGKPLSDVSNLDERGRILEPGDDRRVYSLANRLWHSDASFKDPPAKYSMLSAKVVPPKGGETEYADARSGYASLPPELQEQIEGLRAHHSIASSKEQLGLGGITEEQRKVLPGADHPIVHVHAGSNRKSLYAGSHAESVVGWPLPEGKLLLRELVELATLPQFVYRHHWLPNDVVIWDNRTTMHRGRAFDDARHRRDLRRATTMGALDSP